MSGLGRSGDRPEGGRYGFLELGLVAGRIVDFHAHLRDGVRVLAQIGYVLVGGVDVRVKPGVVEELGGCGAALGRDVEHDSEKVFCLLGDRCPLIALCKYI